MKYISTRDGSHAVSSAEAIASGLAPDGGLYLPDSIPKFSMREIEAMSKLDYAGLSAEVLSRFLTDFTKEELLQFSALAYGRSKFQPIAVAPVVVLGNDSLFILELFHGPTCAFKDFALQMLPHLLTASLKKLEIQKTSQILAATSGDPGKAALEGFKDVPGTKICVFYPDGGVSRIQQLQMTTQEGANVMVLGVQGNFDDAQRGVKAIFTDTAFQEEAAQKGYMLSSANSINWGRLAPQIAYYFSAYCQLLRRGKLRAGNKINLVVPTGNFGNILAAYYAKMCGLPVNKLICASNRNNVLTEFINTGIYNRNRAFYNTSSPSMDILVSSNLERMLYLLCAYEDAQTRSDEQVSKLMQQLDTQGSYEISDKMREAMKRIFDCGYADDNQTRLTIKSTSQDLGYLSDPHTAVAIKVYRDYAHRTEDKTPSVIVSTASPFKFADCVLRAAYNKDMDGDEFVKLDALSKCSRLKAPAQITALGKKEERFQTVIDTRSMKDHLSRWLL